MFDFFNLWLKLLDLLFEDFQHLKAVVLIHRFFLSVSVVLIERVSIAMLIVEGSKEIQDEQQLHRHVNSQWPKVQVCFRVIRLSLSLFFICFADSKCIECRVMKQKLTNLFLHHQWHCFALVLILENHPQIARLHN